MPYSACHSFWLALHLTYMAGVLLAIGIAGLAIDLHGRGHNDYLLVIF